MHRTEEPPQRKYTELLAAIVECASELSTLSSGGAAMPDSTGRYPTESKSSINLTEEDAEFRPECHFPGQLVLKLHLAATVSIQEPD